MSGLAMSRLSWRHFALLSGTGWFLILVPCLLLGQEEEEEAAVEVRQARVMWTDETIDQWIFGSGRNAQQARKRLESQLALKIDELDRTCKLTDVQKKKLHLAGQGDIKRLFDDMIITRKKFDKLRNDQNAINQIFQEIQPLQMRISAGIFRSESFYQKSVSRTLSPEQAASLEKLDFDRRTFRYHAKILLALTVMDTGVPLRDEQRQRLIQLLQAETKPPKRFGQFDNFVVLLQMAKLPPEKLKPIFDERQWKALQAQLEQAKQMERHLQLNGILDQEPAKAVPDKAEPVKILPQKEAADTPKAAL